MHPLSTYLHTAAQTRYQIGLHDCITHISRLADLLAGTDITGALSGTYATKWGGLARHAKGGLAEAIRTHLLHHGFTLAPPPYQNADIILTDLDHPGIWFENQIHAQPVACTGTLTLHPRHAKQALRWPHPSPYQNSLAKDPSNPSPS
jgi:hypothetical protein